MTPRTPVEIAAEGIAARRDAWRPGETIPHPYVTDAEAALSALAREGFVVVPKEPTKGLLISMALRMDHGFFVPAHEPWPGVKLGHTDSYREVVLADLRKAYEEAVGEGFYTFEREDYYRAMLSASPQGGKP